MAGVNVRDVESVDRPAHESAEAQWSEELQMVGNRIGDVANILTSMPCRFGPDDEARVCASRTSVVQTVT